MSIPRKRVLREPLELVRGGGGFADRYNYRMHVTVGGLLVRDASQVLVIEHLSYGITLQPGGHTEPYDTSLIAAAVREVTEETGVDPASIRVSSLVPAYVEYGRVPARPHKGEPEHYHLDFGFAMTTENGDIGTLQASEITGATWLGLAEAEARIGSRMARAVREPA